MKILKRFLRKILKICKPYPEYIERNTRCDICECLQECIREGNVIEITNIYDNRKHYAVGLMMKCCEKIITKAEEKEDERI